MADKPTTGGAARVSAGLFGIFQAIVQDPERKQPATLQDVRRALLERGVQWSREGELMHPQDQTSLIIELDELIKDYGDEASPAEWIDANASGDPSRASRGS